jgi:hypothetical protein
MIYRGPDFLAVVRIIRLLAHHLLSLSQSARVSPVELLLTGEEWEGVGEEPNHTTARKPGPL